LQRPAGRRSALRGNRRFQFFPSCSRVMKADVARFEASNFQFFPSCSLKLRTWYKEEATVYFQFFPSCSYSECPITKAINWLYTFNSFPVAAQYRGADCGDLGAAEAFNSFPVAAWRQEKQRCFHHRQFAFNSFPVAAYSGPSTYAPSAQLFQFFPSCSKVRGILRQEN